MVNNKLKLEELSREQILDLADASGRKLGFLLATAPLEDDVKGAIAHILDTAEPAQLDVLTKILEEKYLEAENENTRLFLRSELAAVNTEIEARRAVLEKETVKKLDALLEK